MVLPALRRVPGKDLVLMTPQGEAPTKRGQHHGS
jgi:hypothetical protein